MEKIEKRIIYTDIDFNIKRVNIRVNNISINLTKNVIKAYFQNLMLCGCETQTIRKHSKQIGLIIRHDERLLKLIIEQSIVNKNLQVIGIYIHIKQIIKVKYVIQIIITIKKSRRPKWIKYSYKPICRLITKKRQRA